MTLDPQRLLLIVGATCIMIGMGIGGKAMLPHHIRWGRRMYWTGIGVGVPLFLAATWGDPVKTLQQAAVWACMAIGFAYLLTPYLRIGRHVYALPVTRRRYAQMEHSQKQ